MKTSRREFIGNSVKAALATSVGATFTLTHSIARSHTAGMVSALTFSQVKLPYAFNALEPNIDAQTMEIHYTRHHTGYVKKVNDAIAAESIKYDTVEDFFKNASRLSANARNNGGGAWNHNFFWQVMKPGQAGQPSGKVADAIQSAFGSFEKFKEQFTQAAMSRFGSGWAWLVDANGKLIVGSTPNQDNPMMDDAGDIKGTPLLGIDVWEHAYYLKYQNKRNEYVANWWNVVNWDAVAERLGRK